MKSIIKYWKEHPKFRILARTAAVFIASFVVNAYRAGEVTDLASFGYAVVTATMTFGAGLIGLEPFIGLKSKVVVPADQAVQK